MGRRNLGYTLFAPGQNPKVLDWVFSQGNYQRQFILNAQGELRRKGEDARESLLIDCVGNGSWSLGAIRAQRHDSSRFSWDALMTPAAFRKLSARDVWRIIGELLADPQSDAAFARRFALMGEEERHALIFREIPIARQEFETTLRAFAIAQDLWEQESYDGEVCFDLYKDGRIYLGLFDEAAPVSAQLKRGVEALRQSFMPINQEVANFSCVKEWLHDYNKDANFVIARPSAHERLEAKLRWRDWLASVEDSPR